MTAIVIERILRSLNLPYTRTYLYGYMDLLPLNDTLWAIKKTLDHYGIDNSSFSIADKTKVRELNRPFVTQWNGDFVLVKAITSNQVVFFDSKGYHKIAVDEFIKLWSGVVLLYESKDSSSEPNYISHRKAQIQKILNSVLVFLSATVLLLFALCQEYGSGIVCIELSLSIIGFGISILLLKKHLHIPSPTAEKLCNIVSHGKCAETTGHKLKNTFSPIGYNLSELGIAFFGVNALVLLIFSAKAIPVLFFSFLLALPLSIWSIGWQLVKRSWCTLCVLVMLTVWTSLGILLAMDHVFIYANTIFQFIGILCSYWLFLQGAHYFSIQYLQIISQRGRINALQRAKYDKGTWNAVLASCNTPLPVDIKTSSSLIFGEIDTELPLITVIGNPFCNPCARMHHRLQPLLDAGFPIQYVYTYFNPDLAPINKEIVSSYFINGPEKTWDLLAQWYTGNKELHPFNQKDDKHIPDYLKQQIISELEKQDAWIKKSGITSTPTILINGKAMPSHYVVEDLLYIY